MNSNTIIFSLTAIVVFFLLLTSCSKGEEGVASNQVLQFKVSGIEPFNHTPTLDNTLLSSTTKQKSTLDQTVSFDDVGLKADISIAEREELEPIASISKDNMYATSTPASLQDLSYILIIEEKNIGYTRTSAYRVSASTLDNITLRTIDIGQEVNWSAVSFNKKDNFPILNSNFEVYPPNSKTELLYAQGKIQGGHNMPPVQINFQRKSARIAVKVDASLLDAEIVELEVKPIIPDYQKFILYGLNVRSGTPIYMIPQPAIEPLYTDDFEEPANTAFGQVKIGYYYMAGAITYRNLQLEITKCKLKRKGGEEVTLGPKTIQFTKEIETINGESTLLTIKLHE